MTRQDPQEAFFNQGQVCPDCGDLHSECVCFGDDEYDGDDDYDGQPSMYEEYQDLYGGDDWDHGQYDDFF